MGSTPHPQMFKDPILIIPFLSLDSMVKVLLLTCLPGCGQNQDVEDVSRQTIFFLCCTNPEQCLTKQVCVSLELYRNIF